MATEISLVESPLDAVLGEDGQWTGPGAEHLNRGRMDWPTRLDFLREGGPEEATIEFIEASDGGSYDLEYAKKELAAGAISVATFKVVAKVGARITGCVWVEGSRTAEDGSVAYVESPFSETGPIPTGPEIIMVKDGDRGDIMLRIKPIDVALGLDGLWYGVGADLLNFALQMGGMVSWPKRADQLVLQGATIELGDLKHAAEMFATSEDKVRAIVDSEWPEALRQTTLAAVSPFRIVAVPGARITGRWLTEIQ